MAAEELLVKYGARYRTPRLRAQANYFAGLASEDEAELSKQMWTPDRTAALEKLREDVTTRFSDKDLQRNDTIDTSRKEDVLLGEAKGWIARVLGVAKNAYMLDPGKMQPYEAKETLGRSEEKVRLRVDALLGVLSKPTEKAALSAWTEVEPLTAEGKTLSAELTGIGKSQGVKIADLPKTTQDFFRLKGELYVAIKRLQRCAKSAFARQRVMAARYHLNNLYGRHDEAKGKHGPEAPTGGSR